MPGVLGFVRAGGGRGEALESESIEKGTREGYTGAGSWRQDTLGGEAGGAAGCTRGVRMEGGMYLGRI